LVVGVYRSLPGGYQTLAEQWDGRTKSLIRKASASPSSYDSELRSFAAVSATDAWAVGSYQDLDSLPAPLAEHWDGNYWTPVATDPHAPAASEITFNVTCEIPVGQKQLGIWQQRPSLDDLRRIADRSGSFGGGHDGVAILAAHACVGAPHQ
jgi:hypothetical protein